jgi:DHA2 family multidrug resistance protein
MSAPAEARFFSRRWLVAIAVMSSAIMEVLDTSVVNVSLPHIAGSLSSTTDEATWVLTSYIVANAIICQSPAGYRTILDANDYC